MSEIVDVSTTDPWSFLDYKKAFAKGKFPAMQGMSIPSWAHGHERRLMAYFILEDYYRTASRKWLNTDSESQREKRREYGDAYMMVEAVLSSVLGEEQTLEVDGYLDEIAAVAPAPATTPTESPADTPPTGPATAIYDLLTEWMVKERFLIKLNQAERKAIKLGDAVYVLGWDEGNERPRLRVWDPGFYFPVLDDWENDTDWPKRVHIAWEYEKEIGGKKIRFLRRITWEMRPIEGNTETLPWNTKPHTETCWLRELEWRLNDDVRGLVDDLSEAAATEIKEDKDLNIDFIPVVHLPNTVSEDEHYGTSNMAPVLQIIDDMQATDTDLQAAASTTGTPMVSSRGQMMRNEDGGVTAVGPGQVFESEGGVELLDTSRSLDALLKNKDSLLDRFTVNGRVPNTLIGRIDPQKVASGIVLTLSFQPHSNMIRHMRLVRQDKYDLLLKFVIRFYMQAQRIDSFVQPHLVFGSYLPSDKQETATIIWNLVNVNAISLETAIQMMMKAGFPIDDIQREVKRIQSQDYEGAKAASEASGDINAARAMLGLSLVSQDEIGQPVDNQNDTGATGFGLDELPDTTPPFG